MHSGTRVSTRSTPASTPRPLCFHTAHAERNPCEYSEYPCEYSEYPARSHSIGHSSRGTHCTQQLHRIHALQSSARLQLEQAAAAGTEKALLARVTAQNPDASFIELLRLFKARCRMGARSARCTRACCHRVCGAVASAAIDRRSHSRPLSPGRSFDGSVCLCGGLFGFFRAVRTPCEYSEYPCEYSEYPCEIGPFGFFRAARRLCLFGCLVVCLFRRLSGCDMPWQTTPSMAPPAPYARRLFAVTAYAWLAAQECVAAVRALVRRRPTPPSRCRTTARRQCVGVEHPRRRAPVLSAFRARVATPTALVACEHAIAHKRKAAAEATVDGRNRYRDASACSGSRCSSP